MADRLLRLEVENFRSLQRIDLPLNDLTVLVGPNAVGKTNVLRVFGFLADIIHTDLEPALDARGGFDEVAFWGGKKAPTSIRIKLDATWTAHASPNAPDEYELRIQRRASGSGYSLSRREDFRFKRTPGRGRRITISGEEARVTTTDGPQHENEAELSSIGIQRLSSGLSTLPRLAKTEGGTEVTRFADRLSSFRVFDVNVEAARRPARFSTRRSRLDVDAGNLSAFLLELHRDGTGWEQLVEDAKAILPQLEDLELRVIGGPVDEVTVMLRESGLRRPTPLADASYGTVRLLGLLALLYDPNPPALTCIEEIDHGLHPHAIELLVDRLREASRRSQYLVATHSPALVDRLKPEEFVVCERDSNGASHIPALSLDRVRDIVRASEDQPLGELWFSGSLGGGL